MVANETIRRGAERPSSGLALGIEGRHRFDTRTVDYRPYWLVEYRNALANRSDVAINYVLLPVASDYVLGLRNSFDDTLSIGAGLDMDLPRGWQLSLLYRHEQAGGSRADSYGLRLNWGSQGVVAAAQAMAAFRDPDPATMRQP